jgi:hypothetical protein
MRTTIGMLAIALLSSCQQPTPRETNSVTDEAAPTNIIAPAPRANEAANAASPEDRTPLAEPKGAIDPKSAEAAGQVVQHYGALIEQDRFAEAANCWGDPDTAAAFAKQLQTRRLKHLEIGKPGDAEGAAGSIYLTIPVSIYGASNRSAANVILRRVNEVPGSTKAQRRWHIERIEWKA